MNFSKQIILLLGTSNKSLTQSEMESDLKVATDTITEDLYDIQNKGYIKSQNMHSDRLSNRIVELTAIGKTEYEDIKRYG